MAVMALTFCFDSARVDRERVRGWWSRDAYWSIGIGRDVFERALANSPVASAFLDDKRVAFARAVNDRAMFVWPCDVFVAAPVRWQGFGTRLVRAIIEHPGLRGLRRRALRTRDAHLPYERFGFTAPADPRHGMERHNPDVCADRKCRSDPTRTLT